MTLHRKKTKQNINHQTKSKYNQGSWLLLFPHKQNTVTLGKLISSPQPGPESSRRTSEDAGEGRSPKSQHLKEAPASPPPNHCSTASLHLQNPPCFNSPDSRGDTNRSTAGSDVKALKKRSPSLFYKQSRLTLSLFKPNKPEEEQRNARLYQRRGSEPGRQLLERASTFTRARLRSDPGLKVTRVDSQQELKTETHFCLSPGATKAVRDYFGSHPYSNPQSSQQVAHALVESRREWLKRCNNPSADADLDQLLFSEESFVWPWLWRGNKLHKVHQKRKHNSIAVVNITVPAIKNTQPETWLMITFKLDQLASSQLFWEFCLKTGCLWNSPVQKLWQNKLQHGNMVRHFLESLEHT